ncbi:MAG: tryptophan--tRNA ligase [candidate division WOR-3 bacterium]|nr:tryptophan--tRNA ligase [candidate division WOR-3 bacterium]MCX7756777.1 tryptophan--tRNA ligase [candidate division WOR-3 bacterium]
MSAKKVITSGMRPTGSLHLGNLIGALENWVKLQDEYQCFYFIVDWHSLTTPGSQNSVGYQYTTNLADNIYQMALDWLSAGLDPNKSTIFIQSHVPEVAELFLLLGMITPLGWLERNPTYREMLEDYKIEYPTYGLLGYPTLQAADILIYKGEYVPVGKDQESHVNLARDIAGRFNNIYGKNVFPLPEALLTQMPKVPSLDNPNRKMSKSSGNYIAIAHSPEETVERVKSMFTDPAKIRKNDKGHPDGCVVFSFHTIYNKEKIDLIRFECQEGKRGCVDCKMELANVMNKALFEIRERRKELANRPQYIKEVLFEGAQKARSVAQKTLAEVKEVMKLNY